MSEVIHCSKFSSTKTASTTKREREMRNWTALCSVCRVGNRLDVNTYVAAKPS